MDHSTKNDFDFLFGRWRVLHRRLAERLADCHDWQEFEGSCVAQPLLAGLGNIDDNVLDLPAGAYRAATLRAFDEATGRWAIWWLDARHPHHPIDPPMVGSFEAGTGTFYADETLGGKPVRVRFLWTGTRTASPKWEQAFSPDAGRTWETNWTMSFVRAADAP
jgi:hypothetical protein